MAIKPDEIIRLRNEGMAYALTIARQVGVDGLAEEVKKRGYLRCSVKFTPEELDKSCDNVAERIYNNMLTMVYATLHDVWGFAGKRLTDFKREFDKKVISVGEKDGLNHYWCRFEDYAEEANRLYNFGIDLDKIRETQEINDHNDKIMGTPVKAEEVLRFLNVHGFEEAAQALRAKIYDQRGM